MVILNRCIQFHCESDKTHLVRRRASIREQRDLTKRWVKLLNQNPSEAQVQDFFEHNPALLPGLTDLHNGPLHDVVVAKLPLGPDYKTDFAFVTRNSMALQFTFIEIEAPNKRIFNKDGSFSQHFYHARQQVADWIKWAEVNMNTLLDIFGPMFTTYDVTRDQKNVRGYLLYGRREEVETDQRRKERWQTVDVSSDKRIITMTYDRLSAHLEEGRDFIVCTYENRGLYAKAQVI